MDDEPLCRPQPPEEAGIMKFRRRIRVTEKRPSTKTGFTGGLQLFPRNGLAHVIFQPSDRKGVFLDPWRQTATVCGGCRKNKISESHTATPAAHEITIKRGKR